VLKPGGRPIVSVDHPFAENLWHREAGLEPDYFATYNCGMFPRLVILRSYLE
jgi:hypothetical protein